MTFEQPAPPPGRAIPPARYLYGVALAFAAGAMIGVSIAARTRPPAQPARLEPPRPCRDCAERRGELDELRTRLVQLLETAEARVVAVAEPAEADEPAAVTAEDLDAAFAAFHAGDSEAYERLNGAPPSD